MRCCCRTVTVHANSGRNAAPRSVACSPAACRAMIDGARGRSALTRIEIYPGASHDFDRANLPLHAIGSGGTDAALPERGHIGTDAEARSDSQARVAEWLAR